MLPKLADAVEDVPVSVFGHTVTFQCAPIPAPALDKLRDEHRKPDGTVNLADIVLPVVKAGTVDVFSDTEPDPRPLTDDEWDEIATDWPEAAHKTVFAYVWRVSVEGVDPAGKAPKPRRKRTE